LCHRKALIETGRIKVIEKYTAYTACFFAMFEIKILITPLLKLGMKISYRKALAHRGKFDENVSHLQ
jgi:hypothetical protein